MKLQLPLVATTVDGKNVIADNSGQKIFTDEVNDIRMCIGVCNIINTFPSLEREICNVVEELRRPSIAIEDIIAAEVPPRRDN